MQSFQGSGLGLGEYLVGKALEKKYNVWIPSRDTGIDLLVTDRNNTKLTSVQVKFSKDFSLTALKEILRPNIKGIGWWTLKRDKILLSKAEFWVFVLYSFSKKAHDFIIIKPAELLNIFEKTNRNKGNIIQCYITVTNQGFAFETRGLNGAEMQLVCDNNFTDNARDLRKYLNEWTRIKAVLS
jgi:hypothetical protein